MEKFKTIQNKDKNVFDDTINTYLKIGWEIVDGSFKILENDIYSCSIIFNEGDIKSITYYNDEFGEDNKIKILEFINGRIIWFYDVGVINYLNSNDYYCQKHCEFYIDKEGFYDGTFKCYHDNGNLAVSGSFIKGRPGNKWIRYDKKKNLEYELLVRYDGWIEKKIKFSDNDSKIGSYKPITIANNFNGAFTLSYLDSFVRGDKKFYWKNGNIWYLHCDDGKFISYSEYLENGQIIEKYQGFIDEWGEYNYIGKCLEYHNEGELRR